jgi:WD40 repeat protein
VQIDLVVAAGRTWASFSADGRRLVTAGENGEVHIVEVDSERELARLRPHSAQVWAAALDPTGERVASGGEDAAVVLSTLSGAPPVVLGRHGAPVYSVQFSPDGKSVLSGGAGGAVRLWNLNGGVEDFTGHDGDVLDVAFSRDGSRLASAGADGTVRIWDRRERRQAALLRGHEGAATSVRFSPDGSQVATTGEDGTIKVWDATSARLLLTRRLFEGSGSAVDFGNDGRAIVSASEADGVLRTSVCEVCGPVDEVLALARSRPVRTLTPEEEQRFAS